MRFRLKQFLLPFAYARRDLRRGARGFYIFLGCLILGVAAIAGIQSLSRGLVESLHHDGRYILGGDVALRTIYEPAPVEQVRFLHDKMGPITVVMETRAMARRTDDSQAALVELKAVDPFYPLYGKLSIVDAAGAEIQTPLQDLILPPPIENGVEKDEWGVLVEKELLPRLGVGIGDWVMLGEQRFQIRGIIAKEPDRIGAVHFSIAPRAMISSYTFARTGLKKLGSQVYYDHKVLMPYVKTFEDLDVAKQKIIDAFPKASWKGRDFLSAAPQVERMVRRLTLFFTLIGLATLLIGGVGVSNAVRGFLDGKLADIATLKCLGAPQRTVFRIYLAEILTLATLGVSIGLGLGAAGAKIAGHFLTAKLALSDQVGVYPGALALAAGFGYLTTLCFSLWPLGRAMRAAPADLFRDAVSPAAGRPSLKVLLWIFITAESLALLAIATASDRTLAAGFAAGTALAFALFALGARGLKSLLHGLRGTPQRPALRLAVRNLTRPGNATTGVVLSLGLGLTVLVAVGLVQYNFSRLVRDNMATEAPSFFFLDIEPGQKEDFARQMSEHPSARNLVMAPSFRGRVVAVNGKAAEDALVDPNESWVINSDRGITVAADLPAYSTVVEGRWWNKDYQGPPVVSIATNVARAFGIGVGDRITINLFGSDISATVANVREINWGSFTMNFAITFAPGLLDKAPANFIATVRIDPAEEEAMQNTVARHFRNVTVVRVRDALDAAQTLIRAVAQAVAISAGVTLVAGLLVLAGSIAAARRRHLYDAVVLKVLGAQRRNILATLALEYLIIGLITAALAVGLGVAAAWALQTYVMDLAWVFAPWIPIALALLCIALTLAAGLGGTWHALRQRPSAYLRNQ